MKLYALGDIAQLTGRTKQSVSNWVTRGTYDFPAPVCHTSAGDIWDAQVILKWIEEHPGLVAKSH